MEENKESAGKKKKTLTISFVFFSQRGEPTPFALGDLAVQVYGRAEYLDLPDLLLHEYAHVQECFLLDAPLLLHVHPMSEISRPFLRTSEDDVKETNPEKMPVKIIDSSFTTVSARGVNVLLETFSRECRRLLQSTEAKPSPQPLLQAVKAICFTLCSVETYALRVAVPGLVEACEAGEDIPERVEALNTAVEVSMCVCV